jgi:hypothetical protein
MDIDANTYQAIVRAIMPADTLSPADAATIIQLGQLAIDVDLQEYSEERSALEALTGYVAATGGVEREAIARVSPLPTDDEERAAWLDMLARKLSSTGSREFAYALAYVLIVSDVELSPIEVKVLDELRTVLRIESDRAAALVEQVSELITPGSVDLRASPTKTRPPSV